MQQVYEDITVNYSYDPAHAPYIYNNFVGDEDIEAKFIAPALYESSFDNGGFLLLRCWAAWIGSCHSLAYAVSDYVLLPSAQNGKISRYHTDISLQPTFPIGLS